MNNTKINQPCITTNKPVETVTYLTAEPFISKKQTAKLMGKSVRFLEFLMKRKEVPFYRIGGHSVAFRWSEVQEHLAKTCRVSRGN